MEILLVLVGAFAGMGSTIIVETYRNRRDQKRWLLERRYDVYAAALTHVNELLTWARNEATAPGGTPAPAGQNFHDFAARLSLVGSDAVQAAWHKLDSSFRQFPMMQLAAENAAKAARAAGHADTSDAIRLRGSLDEIVTRARTCEVELARAMEKDLGRRLA